MPFYRTVFQVPSPQTIVPHFSCPVPTCLLRVIDNDTMTELPKLFNKTVPRDYSPNQHGYTLQAEAWAGAEPARSEVGGKWTLRLVSSNQQQPTVLGGDSELPSPNSQELADYCLPDRDNVLFRYQLKPARDLPVTLHLTLSKQDAFCKLQVNPIHFTLDMNIHVP